MEDLSESGHIRGSDAQIARLDGAQNIPLPETPDEPTPELEAIQDPNDESDGGGKAKPGKRTWNWFRRDSRDLKQKVNQASYQHKTEIDLFTESNRHSRKSHGRGSGDEIARFKTKRRQRGRRC